MSVKATDSYVWNSQENLHVRYHDAHFYTTDWLFKVWAFPIYS